MLQSIPFLSSTPSFPTRHLNIRHTLTAALREKGSHVGYAVTPDQRGRGIATQMLAKALPEARRLTGQDEILIDCAAANLASRRVIEKNGGRLLRQTSQQLYFGCRGGS